uniref:Pre-mRNA-splicing factor SYF2 n=2 Tax=Schistosoma mansoni TaxID=6183 RepID=A0A5K4F5K8_SCHMA
MCPLSVNDVIQDALKSELRNNNEILLLNNGQNNNELNPTENETYDSDDSNAYVRRRVAELNLELSKEKEYFADSYEKKTGRVNFHPQLFYSRIISQDSCEDLNDFSEDEMNELTKLSHNDGDTVSKPIMNANLRHSQQRTSVIPGPVNITENNLGRQASLILKENNVEEPDRNSTDNVNITRTDDVTKKKKHRTASINEQDNNVTKIITKHVSNQNNERIRNSQSQYSNDKPLTEKEKENSIQTWHRLKHQEHMKVKVEERKAYKRENIQKKEVGWILITINLVQYIFGEINKETLNMNIFLYKTHPNFYEN